MQDIVKEMDVSRNSGAITKIATLSHETSISSLWTIYLILYEDSLEIWEKRIEPMGLYIYFGYILTSYSSPKGNWTISIIWPRVALMSGRLQLSNGQYFTNISPIF